MICVVTLPCPVGILCCRVMSLAQQPNAPNMNRSRMNTALPYYSDFFGVTSSRVGLRIRNDEVVGSSPTSSTMFSITLPALFPELRSISFPNFSGCLSRLAPFGIQPYPSFIGVPLRRRAAISVASVSVVVRRLIEPSRSCQLQLGSVLSVIR